MPAPSPRPGVHGPFEQPVHSAASAAERVIANRPLISQNSGKQPAYGLHDHDDGGFTPGKHIVSDADLIDSHPPPPRLLHDPRINPLIPPAGEYEMPLPRIGLSHVLGKRHPAGRWHNKPGSSCGWLGRQD